jgi:DNA-binding NarL/FixJ family response regulator
MNTGAASDKQRVLIVDDHPLLRQGLAKLINSQTDLVCCGEAEGVRSANDAVARHNPDLILLDLRLRDGDALELIKALKAQSAKVVILVISQYDDPLWPERALRAGAGGYVLKQEATEDVLTAIQAVLRGEIYLSRTVAGLMVQKFIKLTPEAARTEIEGLSDRELQVFRFIGQGRGTRDIAAELNLSFKTIETHRENIKHKLGLRDAAALLHHASQWVQQRTARETPGPVAHGRHLFSVHRRDRSAAKPQRIGVRPSPGAATSGAWRCGSNPERPAMRRLLLPGRPHSENFIAVCEQFRLL